MLESIRERCRVRANATASGEVAVQVRLQPRRPRRDLVSQILRLTWGVANASTARSTLEAFRRAYPEEPAGHLPVGARHAHTCRRRTASATRPGGGALM
jgi:hypothetical protein